MTAEKKRSAPRDADIAVFGKLKNLVRQLEDDERRFERDFGTAKVEFKLKADELAWFVAYSTSAETVDRTISRDLKK